MNAVYVKFYTFTTQLLLTLQAYINNVDYGNPLIMIPFGLALFLGAVALLFKVGNRA